MDKWIKCKKCNHQYSNKLVRCPNCNSLTPLSFKRFCGILLSSAIVILAIVGVILGFGDKGNEIPQNTSSKNESTISSVKENTVSSEPEITSNTDTSKPESKNETVSENKNDVSQTVSEKQESNKTSSVTQTEPYIPQDKNNGIKTSEIILPAPFDATDGLMELRSQYAPLTFTFLTYKMDNFAYEYNKKYENKYAMDIGGYKDKIMLYNYKVQYDFADVNSAKQKYQKFLEENSEFFNSQLNLYKKYVPEITGLCVLFEHESSHSTLAKKDYK